MSTPVIEAAERARSASHALALATRAQKDQALQAMVLAFTHLRIVLEPGGAAALAAALFGKDLPDTVIAVATGGNVDPATFATALDRFA